MAKPTKLSPFRLASLLRLEPDPAAALRLFLHPTPPSSKPFRYSPLCYNIIISKLAQARMFQPVEQILDSFVSSPRRLHPPSEALLRRVISLYGRARLPNAALRTFRRIPRPSLHSFNTLLHALLVPSHDIDTSAIHSLCREFTPDACTYNILIRASGSMDRAAALFDEMLQRNIQPTIVTFGTMISSLCSEGKLDEAFRMKESMMAQYGVKPNEYVYTSLIKALCKNGKLDLAMKMKEEMVGESETVMDSAIYSTLIREHFRAGRKEGVVGLLEEMKGGGVKPDTVTHNAMIVGFCEDGDFDAAFEALDEMEKEGCKPDVISYNTIVAGFCKKGRWRDAWDLFDDMPRRGCCPDVVSYRTLFAGMCNVGEVREAGMVLDEMLFKGFKPAATSVCKFVEGLLREGDEALVNLGLNRLAKGDAMVLSGWEMAVHHALENTSLSEVLNLMDCLRIGLV